ncbi:hypothetical protein ABFS83_02G068200 [Erythranthe nasuta]
MELNLSPQLADTTIFEGEGGGYYVWTAAKSPALAVAELAAGKLVLQPRGFALPHYSDSYKIGFVTRGTCTVGLIAPNSPQLEKVIIVIKGDAILVPAGTISWWFNGGDSDATVIFLGKSGQSSHYNPGQFNNSTEFITKIYGLNFNEAQHDPKKPAKSQTNALTLIIKLGPEIKMPSQSNCNIGEYVTNLENKIYFNAKNTLVDGSNNNGVVRAKMTAGKFRLLDKSGVSASLVKLEYDSVISPSSPYDTDYSTHRVFYVTKGSGRFRVVDFSGARLLDATLEEGQLFVVPNLFGVAQLADENGLQFFCVSTSSK